MALKLTAHAQRAALGVVGFGVQKSAAPGRGFSLSARGRGAACQLPTPTPSRLLSEKQRTCAGFSCLWGGGAALKLAGCVRRATLVVVGLGPIEECCTGGRLHSLACSCDATFQLPPPTQRRLPRVQQAHTRRRSLSLGCRRSTQACCARATPRWLRSA